MVRLKEERFADRQNSKLPIAARLPEVHFPAIHAMLADQLECSRVVDWVSITRLPRPGTGRASSLSDGVAAVVRAEHRLAVAG
jgi:hypothetical protein